MGKIKISTKPKASLRKFQDKRHKFKTGPVLKEIDPTAELLDQDFIASAVWECLKKDDPEGIIEIINIHLDACNVTKMARTVNLPKTTFYHSLRSKNPTIKTLCKLVKMAYERYGMK